MADDARQQRARGWIAALCEVPARFAGTYSERVAAERLGDWMRELGVAEVRLEAAASRPRTGWTLALHAGVAFVGLWWGGFAGLVLTALSAWSFQRELSGGAMLLSRLLPSPPSLNVVGRTGSTNPSRRVIFSAHIDTAQAGWLFSPVFADLFSRGALGRRTSSKPPPGPLALPRVLVFAAAALALMSWMGAHGFVFGALRFVVSAGLLLLAALALQWASSAATPGANDNASAVASMLTAAEALLASKDADTEVWVVGTGAEEVGCRGMHAFVGGHLDWDRDSTYYVNFECTGGGALHYVRTEGVLDKFGFPPALLEIARRTAARGEHGEITPTDLLAATDGHVSALHRYPTLSIISLEANGVPRNYHQAGDTADAIDLAMVVRAADFGAAVATAALRAAT